MTPEQKLNHLKEWLDFYVRCHIQEVKQRLRVWDLYNETGMIIYSGKKYDIGAESFENYLQLIEKQ